MPRRKGTFSHNFSIVKNKRLRILRDKLSFTSAKAIQCFCIMNFESKLSVHATQTLHKQNPVLFDLEMAFACVILFLVINRKFSNTKGEIRVGVIGLKTCFQYPIRTNHNKGHEMVFAHKGSPFVLHGVNVIISVISVIRGEKTTNIVSQISFCKLIPIKIVTLSTYISFKN